MFAGGLLTAGRPASHGPKLGATAWTERLIFMILASVVQAAQPRKGRAKRIVLTPSGTAGSCRRKPKARSPDWQGIWPQNWRPKVTARGEGKAYKWILAHKDYPHDEWCLVWPFARDKHGRGMMGFNGQHYWAHRFMCRLVKGDPPTADHTAAHSCGNGHGGCINPHHLDWKTQAENLEDCREHGTLVRHHGGNVRKVLPEEVRAIRAARGFQTQAVLAARYGVSEGTISDIWHGRSHNDNSKINHWTPEETAKLKAAYESGCSVPQAAKIVGRSLGATTAYTYRSGLKSGRAPTRQYKSCVN